MFRVIDLDTDPFEQRGPDQDPQLPDSIHALGEEVTTIIEHAREEGDIPECSCGARVGDILDDSDDRNPHFRWGVYTIWSDGDGLYRVLCEDCSDEEVSLTG